MVKVIRNFVGTELAYFCKLCLEHDCVMQDRVGNYASYYHGNEKWEYKYEFFSPQWGEMLLQKKLNHTKQIFKRNLYPVNSYARKYLKGENLPEHIDRHHLEMGVSVHLGGSAWDIYFDNKPYLLTPGDAIVYHGSVPHYRKELKGDTCYQVFLHYSTNIKYKHHGRDYYKMYGKKSDE